MSFAGRIIYNSINLDFIRPWLSFNSPNETTGTNVVTASGVESDSTYYDKDIIRAVSRTLTGNEVEQLLQFYEFVKDGSSFELLRDRGLGLFVGFEGKSFVGNSLEVGTFTRALTTDSSYYTDPHTGLLTVVNTIDVARFTAGKFGGGFLSEGARTNLITDPSDLGTNWVNVGAVNTVALNTTETLDPVGTNLADKITFGAVPNPERFDTSTAISTNDGVYSILAKSPSGDATIQLTLKDDTDATLQASGDLTVKPFDSSNNVGNGFQKFSVTHESGASNANNWRLETTGTEGDIVYVCGHQLEVGADILFPTRTIGFVSAASVARSADKVVYNTANVTNKLKGTFLYWFKSEWVFNKHPAAILLDIFDSTDSSRFAEMEINASGNLRLLLTRNNDGTSAVDLQSSLSGLLSQNTFHHIAGTYDSTISNGLKIYFDGALLTTSSNDPFNVSDIGTTFTVGSGRTGTFVSFGEFDELTTRLDVLNDSRIKAIFLAGRGLGERRNRWPAVKLIDKNFNPVRNIGTNRYQFQLLCREVIS